MVRFYTDENIKTNTEQNPYCSCSIIRLDVQVCMFSKQILFVGMNRQLFLFPLWLSKCITTSRPFRTFLPSATHPKLAHSAIQGFLFRI